MVIIKGKYANVKVYTDFIEDLAKEQIQNMANHEITKGTQVRIMPDTHAGKGSTIGTTIKLPDKFKDWKVSPNVVGVDIGCGVTMYKLSDKNVDLAHLDDIVNRLIPSGNNIHNKAKNLNFTRDLLNNLSFEIKEKSAYRIHNSLGTLGGGNHFIELGIDEEDNYWLSVHSGSRNLGVQIAKFHQDVAIRKLKNNQVDIQKIIQQLKQENRHNEIESTIAWIKEDTPEITKEMETLAYIQDADLKLYLNDMDIAQKYASASRKKMLDIIVEAMEFKVLEEFDSIHNFIEHDNLKNGIIRKGATSAKEGELLAIPLNMRDGTLICKGKGNLDWNNSAPHGAGRMLSRSQAKRKLSLDTFKKQMQNVYSSSINERTLDESPDAYKPAEEILKHIKPTVDVVHLVDPIYNFKAN